MTIYIIICDHFCSIEADEKKDAFLLIQSLGHAALVFLNKKVLGSITVG